MASTFPLNTIPTDFHQDPSTIKYNQQVVDRALSSRRWLLIVRAAYFCDGDLYLTQFSAGDIAQTIFVPVLDQLLEEKFLTPILYQVILSVAKIDLIRFQNGERCTSWDRRNNDYDLNTQDHEELRTIVKRFLRDQDLMTPSEI